MFFASHTEPQSDQAILVGRHPYLNQIMLRPAVIECAWTLSRRLVTDVLLTTNLSPRSLEIG